MRVCGCVVYACPPIPTPAGLAELLAPGDAAEQAWRQRLAVLAPRGMMGITRALRGVLDRPEAPVLHTPHAAVHHRKVILCSSGEIENLTGWYVCKIFDFE